MISSIMLLLTSCEVYVLTPIGNLTYDYETLVRIGIWKLKEDFLLPLTDIWKPSFGSISSEQLAITARPLEFISWKIQHFYSSCQQFKARMKKPIRSSCIYYFPRVIEWNSNFSLVESGAVMVPNWEYSAFPVDVISIKHKVCVLVIRDPTLRPYTQDLTVLR